MTAPHIVIATTQRPNGAGGMERFVDELASGLRARGAKVDVVFDDRPAARTGRAGGIARDVTAGWRVGRKIARIASKAPLDLVLTNSIVGWYPVRACSQAHMHHGTLRGQAAETKGTVSRAGYLLLTWLYSMTLERMSSRGKRALANSDQTAYEVQRYFRQDATTVWLPLNVGLFRARDRAAARARFGLPSSGLVGLFVGSTHPQKGYPVFEALAARRPDVTWLALLRPGEAAAISGGVRAISGVPLESLPDLYSAADVLVCPSVYEPFGYVVAEALACTTPVVAAPGGASTLLLRGELQDLLVHDPRDVDRFAELTDCVLAAPERYRRAVTDHALPLIREQLGSDAWWDRFLLATDLHLPAELPSAEVAL